MTGPSSYQFVRTTKFRANLTVTNDSKTAGVSISSPPSLFAAIRFMDVAQVSAHENDENFPKIHVHNTRDAAALESSITSLRAILAPVDRQLITDE